MYTYISPFSISRFTLPHRRSQGVKWVHLPPQSGEKFFRCNLQGNFVSALPAHQVHPQAEQESIFRTLCAGQGRFGGGSGSFRSSFEGDD